MGGGWGIRDGMAVTVPHIYDVLVPS